MHDFHLRTERLVIRNWMEKDSHLFHRLNSEEKIMEYFPFRRTRKESDALLKKLRGWIKADGFGFTAIALHETDEAIGFCGVSRAKPESFFPDETFEIGWRLAPEYWGQGFVTEAGFCLLDFAFSNLYLNEVVSFAVQTNFRSIAVMQRLGMQHDPSRDFDHPEVPDSHPQLKRHLFYTIKCHDPKNMRAGTSK